MQLFGVNWVGLNAQNGIKLLLSLAFIFVVLGIGIALRWLVNVVLGRADQRTSRRGSGRARRSVCSRPWP